MIAGPDEQKGGAERNDGNSDNIVNLDEHKAHKKIPAFIMAAITQATPLF